MQCVQTVYENNTGVDFKRQGFFHQGTDIRS